MAQNTGFHDYVMNDVMDGIPGITSRAMFGGWGVYKDGRIFAIIAEGELYCKVDEETRSAYESRGSRPFTYTRGRKTYAMSYWLLPEEILENRDDLYEWIEKAAQAGGRKGRKRKGVKG